MGFFDFLKKKKEEPKEKEIVSLTNLDSWIERKSDEIEQKNKVYQNLVKTRTFRCKNELENGIEILKKINWEKIKSEERIKRIVKENVSNYSLHLEQLTLDLDSLAHENITREKIDMLFIGFDKKTRLNYQKSTFLIGKEMSNIKKIAHDFFRDLDKFRKDNSALFDLSDIISLLKDRVEKLNENEKTASGIRADLKIIDESKTKLDDEILQLNEKVEDVKKTKKYLEEQEKILNSDELKKKLKTNLSRMNLLIDFKSLARIWHKNEREMNIIKMYRENFQEAFIKDNGENIVDIINKSDLKNEEINELFSEIKNLQDKIKSFKFSEPLTFEFDQKIKNFREDIEKLNENKEKEQKRMAKLDLGKKALVADIATEIGKLGVEFTN